MSKGEQGRSSKDTKAKSSKKQAQNSVVKMTKERAKAIQANADKFSKNQDFKSRVMRSADENEKEK